MSSSHASTYTSPQTTIAGKPNFLQIFKLKYLIYFLAVVTLSGGSIALYRFKFAVSNSSPKNTSVAVSEQASVNPSPAPLVKKTRTFEEQTLSYFSKEEIDKLGIVPLPEGFSAQETYKGFRLVRSPQKEFTPTQLKLLHKFIDETPKRLLGPGPTAIVTFKTGEIETSFYNPVVAAFASGSYMFFNDRSFDQSISILSDSSIDQVFSTFLHELVHNVQFNDNADQVDSDKLNFYNKERINWQDFSLGSPLFAEFAKHTNWKSRITITNQQTRWDLDSPSTEQTTDYGRRGIEEDMAETVSYVVMTKDYELSEARRQWALQFLGETYESLKKNKFPYSKEYVPTKPLSVTVYDRTKEDEYKAKYEVADKKFFFAENKTLDDVVGYYSNELGQRGWTGSFGTVTTDQGIQIVKGDFEGPLNNLYIELRDFTNSTRYRFDSKGVWITVLGGYKL